MTIRPSNLDRIAKCPASLAAERAAREVYEAMGDAVAKPCGPLRAKGWIARRRSTRHILAIARRRRNLTRLRRADLARAYLDRADPATITGTAIHHWAGQLLDQINDAAMARNNVTDGCLADALEWFAHQAHGLAPADAQIARRYATFAHRRFMDAGWPAKLLTEVKLPAHRLGLTGEFGTCDGLILGPNLIEVLELKAGFLSKGEAADHAQAKTYACLASLANGYTPDTTVTTWLCQPRLSEAAARFTGCTLSDDDISHHMQWVRDVVAASDHPRAAFAPGDHCTYCHALPHCAAVRNQIMRAIEKNELIGCSTPEDWGQMTVDGQLAKKWGEAAYDAAKFRLTELKLPVVGFKYRSSGSARVIDSMEQLMNLARSLGMEDRLRGVIKQSVTLSDLDEACPELAHQAEVIGVIRSVPRAASLMAVKV